MPRTTRGWRRCSVRPTRPTTCRGCRRRSRCSSSSMATTGRDPVHDVVLVEVGDRLVAATGVDRALRDGVPTYELWGSVDPGVSPPRPRHVADGLDARSGARARLARGPARAGQPRRLLRGLRRSVIARCWPRPGWSRSATSSSCAARSTSRPRRAAARRARDPAGRGIALADDLRRRERGVPRPLGSPRGDGPAVQGDVRPRRARHRACGPSPGTATRSPASSRTGSGPRRTRRSASTAAGSSTSACAGRGAAAAWPAR